MMSRLLIVIPLLVGHPSLRPEGNKLIDSHLSWICVTSFRLISPTRYTIDLHYFVSPLTRISLHHHFMLLHCSVFHTGYGISLHHPQQSRLLFYYTFLRLLYLPRTALAPSSGPAPDLIVNVTGSVLHGPTVMKNSDKPSLPPQDHPRKFHEIFVLRAAEQGEGLQPKVCHHAFLT
jgi:hypothetical protein